MRACKWKKEWTRYEIIRKRSKAKPRNPSFSSDPHVSSRVSLVVLIIIH